MKVVPTRAREFNTAIPTGTWTHLALTLSGNTGTLYLNGQIVGSNTGVSLHPAGLGSTTQNYLGKSQYPDPALQGSLDDFRLYGRALSAAEVLALSTPTLATQPDQDKHDPKALHTSYILSADGLSVTFTGFLDGKFANRLRKTPENRFFRYYDHEYERLSSSWIHKAVVGKVLRLAGFSFHQRLPIKLEIR